MLHNDVNHVERAIAPVTNYHGFVTIAAKGQQSSVITAQAPSVAISTG